MIRHAIVMSAGLAVLAGCGTAPRQPPGPGSALPDALHGTWRGNDGAFLLIGPDRVVINMQGIPPTARRIDGAEMVGGGSVLTLEGGWTLSLVAGRAIQVRRHGGIEVAADCPVLDIGLAGQTAPLSARLIGDGSTTWLPVSTPTPTAMPSAREATAKVFLDAVGRIEDPILLAEARRLIALDQDGVGPDELAAACAETIRRRRLAAIALWDACTGAEDPRIALGDRILADAATFVQTYQTWK